jgi:hypothetical protein
MSFLRALTPQKSGHDLCKMWRALIDAGLGRAISFRQRCRFIALNNGRIIPTLQYASTPSADAELLAFSPERRRVDAFQFTEEFGEVCPVNPNKGDKVMTMTDEKLESVFRGVTYRRDQESSIIHVYGRSRMFALD